MPALSFGGKYYLYLPKMFIIQIFQNKGQKAPLSQNMQKHKKSMENCLSTQIALACGLLGYVVQMAELPSGAWACFRALSFSGLYQSWQPFMSPGQLIGITLKHLEYTSSTTPKSMRFSSQRWR